MDNAEAILEEVKDLVLANLPLNSEKTADDVRTFCRDMKVFFGLWDNAFAWVHKIDPTAGL